METPLRVVSARGRNHSTVGRGTHAGWFEVEPPLLVQPDGKRLPHQKRVRRLISDVAQLEKKLERARKAAVSAERLWKVGVLAKVEAEMRPARWRAEFNEGATTELQKSAGTGDGIVQLQQLVAAETKTRTRSSGGENGS